MAGVIEYSGIVTKARAMTKGLLVRQDYEELKNCQTVMEALDFLKTKPAYASVLSDEYAKISHRDAIERRLMDSLYSDYMRLYRFAGMKGRKFLTGYFIKYEAMIVKRCLRNVYNSKSPDVMLGTFTDFFNKHSCLSLNKLNSSDSLSDFAQALSGSPYEKPFKVILNCAGSRLCDYETALDLYYFSAGWKLCRLSLSKNEADAVTNALGTRIDLLNLQWIYRCKRHFNMENEDIVAMLIPINYKLTEGDINSLLNADSEESFAGAAAATYYSKWLPANNLSHISDTLEQLLDRIYRVKSRSNPYSMTVVSRYLHTKEEEINHLIPIIEGIRYQVPRKELDRFLPTAVSAGMED